MREMQVLWKTADPFQPVRWMCFAMMSVSLLVLKFIYHLT